MDGTAARYLANHGLERIYFAREVSFFDMEMPPVTSPPKQISEQPQEVLCHYFVENCLGYPLQNLP